MRELNSRRRSHGVFVNCCRSILKWPGAVVDFAAIGPAAPYRVEAIPLRQEIIQGARRGFSRGGDRGIGRAPTRSSPAGEIRERIALLLDLHMGMEIRKVIKGARAKHSRMACNIEAEEIDPWLVLYRYIRAAVEFRKIKHPGKRR